ncbi:cold-regulated 413 inner membrane protein 2, chloroplastic isoform X5 [Daucus carota subsp. sativus]|uniref:cold-regulated 413 inner membrane protein 2, chloroplastic isoform X5 n=1 Tax=Daucus carota subsp. sativus TaxID=79200 RepID=UPI00308312A5
MNIKGGFGTSVCSYSPLSSLNLQWINTITSTVLMLLSGTSIQKSFLVPIFALQAPASIISWIKGEYGVWTAFLLLLVRLFLHIPVSHGRGKLEGVILSLTIAGYLAFQHFSRGGSLGKAFDQEYLQMNTWEDFQV